MIKIFCDGCGREFHYVEEEIDGAYRRYKAHKSNYCGKCKVKAEDLDKWYCKREQELKEQLKSEMEKKKEELFQHKKS